MTPLSGQAALEAYFFEARAKVLDLAAILDRIGRGSGGADAARLAKLREAIGVLLSDEAGRAERVQQAFSLGYDAAWERPRPRG